MIAPQAFPWTAAASAPLSDRTAGLPAVRFLGVELHFSGSFVGYANEEVTVYDARFYRAGTIERGSYVYDEADKDKSLFLRDIPARYFSEVVWQLAKATM